MSKDAFKDSISNFKKRFHKKKKKKKKILTFIINLFIPITKKKH